MWECSLLGSKIDEVWSHAEFLAAFQFIHAKGLKHNRRSNIDNSFQGLLTVVMCSSVISSLTPHLISTTCVCEERLLTFPNNDLVLEPMLLPAVLLDLGVDVLHQAVPLHQHVSECGAREDPHNL